MQAICQEEDLRFQLAHTADALPHHDTALDSRAQDRSVPATCHIDLDAHLVAATLCKHRGPETKDAGTGTQPAKRAKLGLDDGERDGAADARGPLDVKSLAQLCSLALLCPRRHGPAVRAVRQVMEDSQIWNAGPSGGQREAQDEDLVQEVWELVMLHDIVLGNRAWGVSTQPASSSTRVAPAHGLAALGSAGVDPGLARLLFAPALVSLHGMVEQRLVLAGAALSKGRSSCLQLGAAAGQDILADADIDVNVCSERLGRVLCAWMRAIAASDMHEALKQRSRAPTPAAASASAASLCHTLLAHLVYISVLWCRDSAAGDVGDELHAALLSGMSPSQHALQGILCSRAPAGRVGKSCETWTLPVMASLKHERGLVCLPAL